MKRFFLLLCLLGLRRATPASAQIDLGPGSTAQFATREEAREALTRRDDFVERMSPFDRSARLKTDREVSEAEYLKFVGGNILDWDGPERQKVTAALQAIQPTLVSLDLPLPGKVLLIKTTGDEEGGAAYTRANAVVLPVGDLAGSAEKVSRLIAHELFHVLSRKNPALRDKLYAAIGFQPCGELTFPKELQARKITNPDAPVNGHCIRLQVDGKDLWAMPILYSNAARYDPARGGPFFNYLQFKLLVVERQDNPPLARPVYEGQQPSFLEVKQGLGYLEQIGNNTDYIIHPEEVLADNFALLVTGKRGVRSPEILENMRTIFKERRP